MTRKPEYMPQMDGLRAVAVIAVLVHHWFNLDGPVGSWGVTLFFVISGYLITKTICRLRMDGVPLAAAGRSFFVRRSLRLFPAYYLVVCIGLILNEEMRRDWTWYVTYASNILLLVRQRWIELTPSWSLAVEEQFYLVWFFTVMIISRSRLSAVLLVLAVTAPATRGFYLSQGDEFGKYTLWAQCDALAAGAFIFVLERAARKLPVNSTAAAVIFLFLVVSNSLGGALNHWIHMLDQILFIIFAAYVVWGARQGFQGLVGRFLSHRAIVHLGKVSYGVYLYHMLTPRIGDLTGLSNIAGIWRLFTPETVHGFVVHCAITVAIATVSFRYFESPIRYSMGRRSPAIT